MDKDSLLRIRKATPQDIPAVICIFDDARNFQRTSGFIQWVDGYPNKSTLEKDLAADSAYIVEYEDNLAGYFFIAYDDPGYEGLTGIWENEGKFAVVHRLALCGAQRGKGLAKKIIKEAERIAAENGARSMRIDTGESNFIMQRIMTSLGYNPKGLLNFSWGPRLTYEKRLLQVQKSR